MASRRLSDLVTPVYELAEAATRAWEAAGLQVIVTCTYRSPLEQRALYAQGREGLAVVNALRSAAGMPGISEKENRARVTNAPPGSSRHEVRRAFDVVPLMGGKPMWDQGAAIWQDVGRIGKSVGLEWAGDWTRFKEYPHFQG